MIVGRLLFCCRSTLSWFSSVVVILLLLDVVVVFAKSKSGAETFVVFSDAVIVGSFSKGCGNELAYVILSLFLSEKSMVFAIDVVSW